MGKIIWEKNKVEEKSVVEERKEVKKLIRTSREEKTVEKNISMGFTANQFIIRLPTQLTQLMKLDPKKAGDYGMKIKWSSSDFDEKTGSIKGEFKIEKNSERSG